MVLWGRDASGGKGRLLPGKIGKECLGDIVKNGIFRYNGNSAKEEKLLFMREEMTEEKSALSEERVQEEAGTQERETDVVVAEIEEPREAEVKITDKTPDFSAVEVKNPRIGKVLKLQEETERQKELEVLRSKRIRQEQEYIDRMLLSVEENLKNTKEEQRINEEFEEHIRREVYRMHGISEDKLQGMTERKTAWYQGAAFALFFLSLVMIALCGILHGFGSEICIFMAFYTAIEGTLLSNGRKQSVVLEGLIKLLYLLLFPMMMVIFVCYELGFEEYQWLVPVFVVAGVVVLMLGAVSYFLYDPYRADRRNKKKALNYIKEMEKTALKEVRLKEKKLEKMEKQRKKEEEKAEKTRLRREQKDEKKEQRQEEKEEKAALRKVHSEERKQNIDTWWKQHKPFGKNKEEIPEKTEIAPKESVSEETEDTI